jgi:hypothetical protein
MRKRRNRRGWILNIYRLLSIPVLEITFDHFIFGDGNLGLFFTELCNRDPLSWSLLIFVAPLVLIATVLVLEGLLSLPDRLLSNIHRGGGTKLRYNLLSLLRGAVSGELIDMIVMILFLLHLTWIPDSLFDWVKESNGYSVGHPLIFIAGFLCTLAFIPKEHLDKKSSHITQIPCQIIVRSTSTRPGN